MNTEPMNTEVDDLDRLAAEAVGDTPRPGEPQPAIRRATSLERGQYVHRRSVQLKAIIDELAWRQSRSGDPSYRINLGDDIKAEILRDHPSLTEDELNDTINQALNSRYGSFAQDIIDARLQPDSPLLNEFSQSVSEVDFNKIADLVRALLEDARLDPEILAVTLDNREKVLFEEDEEWIKRWGPQTPESKRRLQLRLDLLNRVADRLGGRTIFGKPAAEFVFGKVVGGGTRMAARTVLSWAGVAGFVGGGLAGGAAVGAGVGAASGFAVEYFRQLVENKREIQAEWKMQKDQGLELRKVSLKEKFHFRDKKKLAVAAAKGAAMGAVGGAASPLIAAFLEEYGISFDFLTSRLPKEVTLVGVPVVDGVAEIAGGTWRGAGEIWENTGRGIDEVSGGRLTGVSQGVSEAVQQSGSLKEVQDELARTKALLAEAENKIQADGKKAGNVYKVLTDAVLDNRGVEINGFEFTADEIKNPTEDTLNKISRIVAGEKGAVDTGMGLTGIDSISKALANPDQFYAQAGITDLVEVEAGSNPWNETDEIMTKMVKELNIPKPPQDQWNELIRQVNPKLCADNGYSWGAGMPGKDAHFIQIGTKLKVTKEFKDLALNLVKKAA